MRPPNKIPTLLGLLLVILLVSVFAMSTDLILHLTTQAKEEEVPQHVTVTNVTDTSATVTWTTSIPATGAVAYQPPGKGSLVAYDERDTAGKLSKNTSHSVTLPNLPSATVVPFAILTNGKKYKDPQVNLTTGVPLAGESTNLEPAYGTVVTATNMPAAGSLVTLTLEGGQTLSTLTKPSGTWLIPLSLTRTTDLTSILPTTERMTETISVTFEGTTSTAVTDTLNDSPVPEINIGKNYDFRKQQAKGTSGTALALKPNTPAGGNAFPAVLGEMTANPGSYSVSLTTPAQGSALPTTLPLIQGTGIPGKFVAITLGIVQAISGSTIVGADGIWRYTPTKNLAPGKQSVTMTTQDANGKPVAITHTFEIFKSGTQVLGEATPSATLTPTITIEPTSTPTAIPTEESTLAGEPLPTSGSILPTIMLLMVGATLLMGGFGFAWNQKAN